MEQYIRLFKETAGKERFVSRQSLKFCQQIVGKLPIKLHDITLDICFHMSKCLCYQGLGLASHYIW
jgi:hypothetical protein